MCCSGMKIHNDCILVRHNPFTFSFITNKGHCNNDKVITCSFTDSCIVRSRDTVTQMSGRYQYITSHSDMCRYCYFNATNISLEMFFPGLENNVGNAIYTASKSTVSDA